MTQWQALPLSRLQGVSSPTACSLTIHDLYSSLAPATESVLAGYAKDACVMRAPLSHCSKL